MGGRSEGPALLLSADFRDTAVAEQGQRLETIRIDNDGINLAAAVAAAGEGPEVVLEATCGEYWAADDLAEVGAKVHLEKRSMRRISTTFWHGWTQRRR